MREKDHMNYCVVSPLLLERARNFLSRFDDHLERSEKMMMMVESGAVAKSPMSKGVGKVIADLNVALDLADKADGVRAREELLPSDILQQKKPES